MMGQCVSKKKNSKRKKQIKITSTSLSLSLSLSIVSQQEEVFENKEENDVSSNSINNKDFDDDQSL